MKVDFIIIGAMKAGTTSLYEVLKAHPDISFSKIKEAHFFSTTKNWEKDLPKYHKLFKEEEGKLYGEASPSYSAMPEFQNSAKIIHAYNPEMKIIYMVRNPIDRSISHYMHIFERGYTNLPIDEAFEKNPQIVKSSCYFYQVKPYLELFGKEQIFFIDFEDYIKDRKRVLKELSGFLEIDPEPLVNLKEIHANRTVGGYKLHPRYDKLLHRVGPLVELWPSGLKLFIKRLLSNKKRVFKEKPRIKEQTKQKILDAVKPEIPGLEKLLGKDLSNWIDL
ncbi:sulfotransferase domain-containing protein [Draconibacterium sp. IB214405]|uniref:sulfotransferase domain-containing protein n=1 Tax=Draconibacterium sp. IB214405 TaxID=3097352 RepID=UPI002A15EC77|nr:sulfotransferase domain-containing protein [Draconibacterium sp. IB214405]MDX8338069.1 sulfotransferase domain-containing protein [Draconibacterium sp. IB214405]